MKNTVIISAFPCCGKTTCANNLKDFFDFADSDSSNFSWLDKKAGIRHPDFPNNYIEHIKSLIGKKDIIFVSSHKTVREALKQNNIHYILAYPLNTPENKQIWHKRMIGRGNDSAFINTIMDNWDNWLDELILETYPIHYVLNEEREGTKNRSVLDADSLEDILAVA